MYIILFIQAIILFTFHKFLFTTFKNEKLTIFPFSTLGIIKKLLNTD